MKSQILINSNIKKSQKKKAEKAKYNKQWRKKNKVKIKKRSKQYYLNNRKIILQKCKQYNILHREQRIKYIRQYHLKNKKEELRKSKEYDKSHKREKRLYSDIKLYGIDRNIIFKKYNYVCQKCFKVFAIKKLCVHHIDGRGTNTPVHLKNNNIDNLTAICKSCHYHLHNDGENSRNAKLKTIDIHNIKKLKKQNISILNIAKRYNIGRSQISKIINNKAWKHTLTL